MREKDRRDDAFIFGISIRCYGEIPIQET
jgi:hypothetical protein